MSQRQENQAILQLLDQFESDQIETTKHILTLFDNNPDSALQHLRTLNVLLNTKALPSRQRRDVAAIARLVADSPIFAPLHQLIQADTRQQIMPSTSKIQEETIKLIGNICWQNPHFIDNIHTVCPQIIDLLFELLTTPATTPNTDDSLLTIINFFHSISLKEGPIRDHKLPPVFTTFIENIFTHDRFHECLESKKLSALFSTIHKFHSNVNQIDRYVYNALIRAIIYVSAQYKNIAQNFEQMEKGTDISEIKNRVKITDRKLVGLLKLEEKSRSGLFQKIDAFNFVVFLKVIAKIAISRSVVLVETSYDNRIIIGSIVQTIRKINEWKAFLEQKLQTKSDQKQPPEQNQEIFSQMEEEPCIREFIDTSYVKSDYLTETQDDRESYEELLRKITSFSNRYFKIATDTIHRLKEVNESAIAISKEIEELNICKDMQNQNTFSFKDKLQLNLSYLNFQLQVLASRLDRILNILMKLFQQKQLVKHQYYKIIVSQLISILPIFTSKGQQSQLEIIKVIIPDLNNMTVQSDLSNNRYIYEKIDEDHLKTNLHLKVTSTPNSYNLISDVIVKFCCHLSEYEQFLEHTFHNFFHPLFTYFKSNFLNEMGKKTILSLQDIEMLRLMVKIISEIFPSNPKNNKEELVRLKLYHYCLMVQKNNYTINLFNFVAIIVNLLDKHSPASTEQLQDTLENRKEVVKTIFYKLITHRIKIFFSTITTFYDDLRKLSTPREIHTSLGDISLERQLMFTGHIAYVQVMENILKLIILEHRENSLKQEVSGLILMHLFDIRFMVDYEGENQLQLKKYQEQYRYKQTLQFNSFLQKKSSNFIDWVLQNISHNVHKLPMLIKKLLHFFKIQNLYEQTAAALNQIQILYANEYFTKISKMLDNSYFLLEGKHLDLGIKVKRKRSKDYQLVEEFDLKDEVIKLSNICIIISQLMIQYNSSGVSYQHVNLISENYINSIIEFSMLYIVKFAAEVHFPEQANRLIRSTLWIIESYLQYKNIILHTRQINKKLKKKSYRKSRRYHIRQRKQQIKLTKAKNKNIRIHDNYFKDLENQIKNMKNKINSNGEEKVEKQSSKKRKRNKNKSKKLSLEKQLKTLQKSASNTNLHSHLTKTQQNVKQKQKNKGQKSVFQKKVEEYLKAILQSSNQGEKPYLTNLTFQYYIKFIGTNLKKNYISKPLSKYFELSIIDYLEELLKIQTTDPKTVAYHLILSRLGLKLIDVEHIKVDYETGIKRFFFDRINQKISFNQFLKFLETNFYKTPNLSHIIDIIYEQSGTGITKRLPFSYENVQGINQTGKSKQSTVQIRQNAELHLINLKEVSPRRNSTNLIEQQKKERTIKLSDYIPDGDLNSFITILITHAVDRLIQQIDNGFEVSNSNIKLQHQSYTPSKQIIEPFNVKVVVHTLQFLIRQSPSLAPWIAKFKCKKIIINSLKKDKLKNKQIVSKYVFSLLQKYDQPSQSISQLGFLQVLLRLVSPFLLNTISGLIFELCLDSTPLVQNTKSTEKDELKQKYISFGSVVRQKIVSQLDFILFGGNPLQHILRKATILNLFSVLVNIRQMARLLIESNFIPKLYTEYASVLKQYNKCQNCAVMPGVYLTKIFITFFLQPISILQELNIAFHHNKKLSKTQNKKLLSLLILNEEGINAQLIPIDVLKKSKFKSDWPYAKQNQRKQSFNSERNEQNDSEEESFEQHLQHHMNHHHHMHEQSSISDDSDEVEQDSDVSDLLEQRFAELQRMEQQQSYMSLSSGNNSNLLNDEWDYSNSNSRSNSDQLSEDNSYPAHDDRIIEQQIQRQLLNNQLEIEDVDEQESRNIEGNSHSYSSEFDQEESPLSDEENFSHNQGDLPFEEDPSSLSAGFMSERDQEIDPSDHYTHKEQIIIKHREEEQLYETIVDVISFEKINVVPKISKNQVCQVINLRFFLQMYNYKDRELQNQCNPRIRSSNQLFEQKKIKQSLKLLDAFQFDLQLKLTHYIEWNQVYRYDHFLKKHPLTETALFKLFGDEHESGIARKVRRNGIIHQGSLMQIIPGTGMLGRETQLNHNLQLNDARIDAEPSEHSSSNSHSSQHPPSEQEQSPMERLAEVMSSQVNQNAEDILEEQQRQMPELINMEGDSDFFRDRFQQDYAHGHQQINQILQELNLNMSQQEFRLLAAQAQTDIIRGYYMAEGQRQRELPLHNSPIRIVPLRNNNLQDLNQARNQIPALDMSPRIMAQEVVPGNNNPQPVNRDLYSSNSQQGPEGVDEEYRKMSMEHTMKVNKDIMQTINKNGKNNNKFYEIQDHELEKILNMLYQLNEKQHKYYPYCLIQTLCINTKNLQKIISSLITTLYLSTDKIQNVPKDMTRKTSNNTEQYTEFKTYYKAQLQPIIALKIFHLLNHLTKNYSIAMSLLRINVNPVSSMVQWVSKMQHQKTSFEMLIMIIEQSLINKNTQLLQFLINLIENISVHYFYKNINALVSKNQVQPIDNEGMHDSIEISQESAKLFASLLQNNFAKEHIHTVSRIIMRLCTNQKNLSFFIKFMESLVKQLSLVCLRQIERVYSSENIDTSDSSEKQYLKIVNLMNIFFEMVVSFKAYPTTPVRHDSVLNDLRKIVQIQELQLICDKASEYLFISTNPNVQTIMGEILECYFILYEIALATSLKQPKTNSKQDDHNHIAELGQIKELRKNYKSTQLQKQQEVFLGNFNLSKLWKESINQPAFKTYVNNCIKKKLNNFSQQQAYASLSIFEVPIFKVAISTSHMLTFDNKRLIFKTQLKRLRKKSKYHLIHMAINRDEVFEDSFTEIMHHDSQLLKGKLKIQFRDEQGEDAGGITREWFQLLSKKMFDPNYALFKSGSTGNTYHPSCHSYINSLHLKYFKFIGRIIGKALYDGYLLDAYFTPAFYKHILNLPITYLDMEEEDYEYFKSLKWILENSPIEDYLELNFTYSFDNFGQVQNKDLITDGSKVLVTEQNKLEYVQLSSYAKMATSIKAQLQSLLQGFHQLIPHRLIKIFNQKQLEIMISGRPTIDIEDLRRNTQLVNYVKNDQIIAWLFEVLESFDMQLRTAFLQFVTGSSRVPVEGFKDLRGMNGVQKFNIHKQFQQQRLPRAHTCFNQLDLPNYKTKQILIEKLMLAITEGKEGFHMI